MPGSLKLLLFMLWWDSINSGIVETVGFQFAMFIATLTLYELLYSSITA